MVGWIVDVLLESSVVDLRNDAVLKLLGRCYDFTLTEAGYWLDGDEPI